MLLSNPPYYIRPEGFLFKFVLDVTLENLHQIDGHTIIRQDPFGETL